MELRFINQTRRKHFDKPSNILEWPTDDDISLDALLRSLFLQENFLLDLPKRMGTLVRLKQLGVA